MTEQSLFVEISERDAQSVEGGAPWAWAPAAVLASVVGGLNAVYNAGKDLGRDILYDAIYG